MRVLLAAKDLRSVFPTAAVLTACRMVVDQAETGEEALALARRYDYDVIVIDVGFNDADGYDFLRRTRASQIDTPVMILANGSRPLVTANAFGTGADDFLIRPFEPDELTVRLQALVRRSKGFSRPVLQVGPVLLDLMSREVTAAGQRLHVSAKEYSILELLMLRKDSVLNKETFLDHLYGGIDEPEMKIIDVFICKLRKKLAQAGADGLIGTVWGCGYMMRTPSVDTSPVGNSTESLEFSAA